MVSKYEVPVLIKAVLPYDINEKVVQPLIDAVKKLGGKMEIKKDNTGNPMEIAKKHLAYNIDGHEEGYYAFFDLEIDNSKIAQLEKQLRSKTDILRYLIIREDQL